MKITLFGAGAWGTAVATLLVHNKHDVLLWAHEEEVVREINEQHTNQRYIKETALPTHLCATTSLNEAVAHGELYCQAIPVPFLRETLEKVKQHGDYKKPWISLSKGIERDTLAFAHQIIEEILQVPVAVLSGPSFSDALLVQDPTGFVCATPHEVLLNTASQLFSSSYSVVFPSTDMQGIAVCGAVKNVITIAVGIVYGAGYHNNAAALAWWHGMEEAKRIIMAYGGDVASLYSVAGIGDMALTAFGGQSKNLQFGKQLGAGKTKQEIEQSMGRIAEGVYTSAALHQLIDRERLHLALCEQVYQMVWHDADVTQLIHYLTVPH